MLGLSLYRAYTGPMPGRFGTEQVRYRHGAATIGIDTGLDWEREGSLQGLNSDERVRYRDGLHLNELRLSLARLSQARPC